MNALPVVLYAVVSVAVVAALATGVLLLVHDTGLPDALGTPAFMLVLLVSFALAIRRRWQPQSGGHSARPVPIDDGELNRSLQHPFRCDVRVVEEGTDREAGPVLVADGPGLDAAGGL